MFISSLPSLLLIQKKQEGRPVKNLKGLSWYKSLQRNNQVSSIKLNFVLFCWNGESLYRLYTLMIKDKKSSIWVSEKHLVSPYLHTSLAQYSCLSFYHLQVIWHLFVYHFLIIISFEVLHPSLSQECHSIWSDIVTLPEDKTGVHNNSHLRIFVVYPYNSHV